MLENSEKCLQAVIFDWAGTVVDYGSRAPAQVFVEVFRRQGVHITIAEAREPMGRAKRDHLATIVAMPRVAAVWREVHGRSANESDIDSMYYEFLPLQKELLKMSSEVIPGVPAAVAACRQHGLRIGTTTGYTRELMEVVVPAAKQGGFDPELVVCADDVVAGRPAPWMLFRAAELLGSYPMCTVIAVDDTPVGIVAGRNAGMWTVAVAKTGNALGLSEQEVQALPTAELESRLQSIRAEFYDAGAHYVIDGVADLPPLLNQIIERLQRGDMP